MSFLSRVKQLFGGDKPAEEESPVETPEVAARASSSLQYRMLHRPCDQQAGERSPRVGGFRRSGGTSHRRRHRRRHDHGHPAGSTKGRAAGSSHGRTGHRAHPGKLNSVFDLDSTLHTTGSPAVILVTGVNGVGKTSSIAKLANMLKQREPLGPADCCRYVSRRGR